MSNTDLPLYSFGDIGMQIRQKRKALLYAGIGFVLIGVVSMVLTYTLCIDKIASETMLQMMPTACVL